MLKAERQAYILKALNLHHRVQASDLCRQLNVSEDTVRRDLQALADAGSAIKVHGGALSLSYYGAQNQQGVYAEDAKQVIARKALGLIHDNMLILAGAGTTVRELAKTLPPNLHATFCTLSLSTAEALSKHPNIEVIMIGGRLSKRARVCVGGDAIMHLSEMKFDLCLMGTNSIDVRRGLSDADLAVVQLKKAMIRSARQVAVMTISEKLNTVQRGMICGLNQIHYLLTEAAPDSPWLLPYREAGLEVR